MRGEPAAMVLVRMREHHRIHMGTVGVIPWQAIAKLLRNIGDIIVVGVIRRGADMAVDQDVFIGVSLNQRHVPASNGEKRNACGHGWRLLIIRTAQIGTAVALASHMLCVCLNAAKGSHRLGRVGQRDRGRLSCTGKFGSAVLFPALFNAACAALLVGLASACRCPLVLPPRVRRFPTRRSCRLCRSNSTSHTANQFRPIQVGWDESWPFKVIFKES